MLERLCDLWGFMRERKKFWLAPIIVVMVLLGLGDFFACTITKYPYSYHGIAASLLDDRLADTTVRLVNLGQPSISFYQHVPDRADVREPFAGFHYSMLNLSEDRYYSALHKQLNNFDPAKLPALESGYVAAAEFAAIVSDIRRSGTPEAVMLSPGELQVSPREQQELARRFDILPGDYDYELPAYLPQEIFERTDDRVPALHLIDAFRCAGATGDRRAPPGIRRPVGRVQPRMAAPDVE